MSTYHSYTSDPVVPPISVGDIADYARADCDDPILKGISITATNEVINYLRTELVQRNRTLIYQEWPVLGTPTCGVSKSQSYIQHIIELPYTLLLGTPTVYVNGELSTDFSIQKGNPYKLCFDNFYTTIDCDTEALKVEYQAGYGTVDDVPEVIKQAIAMVGSYIYLNRGCTMNAALISSGAASSLQPFRAYGGVVL